MRQKMVKRCRNANDDQWKVLYSLPLDNVVVVSNFWDATRTSNWASKFTKRSRTHDIQMLTKEVSEAGYQMILVVEPPGVNIVVYRNTLHA